MALNSWSLLSLPSMCWGVQLLIALGKAILCRILPVADLRTTCSKWENYVFKIGVFETITLLGVKCTKGHMFLILLVKWRGGCQNHWTPWFSWPKVLQLTGIQTTAQRSLAHEKVSLGTWAALLFLSVEFFPALPLLSHLRFPKRRD